MAATFILEIRRIEPKICVSLVFLTNSGFPRALLSLSQEKSSGVEIDQTAVIFRCHEDLRSCVVNILREYKRIRVRITTSDKLYQASQFHSTRAAALSAASNA